MFSRRWFVVCGVVAASGFGLAACSRELGSGPDSPGAISAAQAGALPPPPPPPSGGGPVLGADLVSFTAGGRSFRLDRSDSQTRILLDGQVVAVLDGDVMGSTPPNVTGFSESVPVYSSVVPTSTEQTPAEFAVPVASIQGANGQPAIMAELPCMEEMAAFGAAALWLSYELYRARYIITGNWIRLGLAAAAVYRTARALANCIERADGQVYR